MKIDKHRQIYRGFLFLTLVLSFLVLLFLINNLTPKLLVYGDYIQYWAAGRLSLAGENPYDSDKVVEYKASHGISEFSEQYPAYMLYPPWIFTLLMPFSIASYGISRILWLFFNISILFITSRKLWNLYTDGQHLEWFSLAIIFTFTPTLYALGTGHVSILHLLGVTFFIHFTQCQTKSWKIDILAGFFISFIFYKPNLLLIYSLIVLIWIFYQKRWWIILGCFFFLFTNTLIAIIFKPDVVIFYLNAISNYPRGVWATPTLGMVLRLIFGSDREWLQLLPSLFGIIWAFIYWRKYRANWNWLETSPILILISITFSPYIWIYDMVVIILPLIFIFSRFLNRKPYYQLIIVAASYMVINFTAFYIHLNNYEYVLFWFSPLLLVWFVFWDRYSVKRIGHTISESKNLY